MQLSSSRSENYNISISSSSNSHYSENDTYDRKVINNLRERSKKDMDNIYKIHRFDYDILRLLV